ncbi:MAG TPA: flagellar hook-associated protein FlgK [Dongiaceae bacterium]|nr:flagellar hook-associated protein FlgK [Dongiaceae bacterium]
MSLVSLLSIARTALLAQQRAMSVTGQNVANAQTPGYTRQVLDLHAADPLWTPHGTVGTGVEAGAVVRMRDTLLDTAYRRSAGGLGSATTRQGTLTQVQNAVNEPSDTGVAAALDQMFAAFGDLATDPASRTSRNLVLDKAQTLVDRLHTLAASLAGTAQDTATAMKNQAAQVNDLTRRIGELNTRILAAGGPEHSAPDLEDQRDVLIDQLSGMVPTQVIQHTDGTIAIAVGDTLLVDGANTKTLDVRAAAGGGSTVGVTGDPNPLDLGNTGSLGALVQLSTVTLPGQQAQLDQFASALATEVNALHRTGYTPAGATGIDFFDPAGTTAASIRLSAAVQGNPDSIAASSGAAGSDGDLALQMAGLGNQPVASLGGLTLRGAYDAFATGVASSVQQAGQDVDTQQALTDNADAQRQSANGVSVDEEMTVLIAQQQAYSAAARLVQTANDMITEVLNMVGTSGT